MTSKKHELLKIIFMNVSKKLQLILIALVIAAGFSSCVVSAHPYGAHWVPGHWAPGYYHSHWVPGHYA